MQTLIDSETNRLINILDESTVCTKNLAKTHLKSFRKISSTFNKIINYLDQLDDNYVRFLRLQLKVVQMAHCGLDSLDIVDPLTSELIENSKTIVINKLNHASQSISKRLSVLEDSSTQRNAKKLPINKKLSSSRSHLSHLVDHYQVSYGDLRRRFIDESKIIVKMSNKSNDPDQQNDMRCQYEDLVNSELNTKRIETTNRFIEEYNESYATCIRDTSDVMVNFCKIIDTNMENLFNFQSQTNQEEIVVSKTSKKKILERVKESNQMTFNNGIKELYIDPKFFQSTVDISTKSTQQNNHIDTIKFHLRNTVNRVNMASEVLSKNLDNALVYIVGKSKKNIQRTPSHNDNINNTANQSSFPPDIVNAIGLLKSLQKMEENPQNNDNLQLLERHIDNLFSKYDLNRFTKALVEYKAPIDGVQDQSTLNHNSNILTVIKNRSYELLSEPKDSWIIAEDCETGQKGFAPLFCFAK